MTEFDWQVLPIVAAARQAARSSSCRRTPARSGGSSCGRRSCRAAPAAPRPSAGARLRPARRCSSATCSAGTATPRPSLAPGRACRRNPAGVRRVFRSRAAGPPSCAGLREVLAERVPEAGAPPALDLRRGGDALPDAVLDRPHRGGADAGDRRPARHRRRLGGDPGARAQGAARHADGADRARRLRARGLPRRVRGGASPGSRFAATRLARGLARAAYAGADVVSPVTDANALLGAGARHRRREDPRHLQRPAAAGARRRRRRARGRSCPSGASTRSRTSTRCCGSPQETLRIVPDAPLPALRRRSTEGEEAYGRSCTRAARAARARRPLPLHGPHDGPQRGRARRRRRADDEHLRGAADVDPRGDGPGPARGLDRRGRRAGRRQGLRHGDPARATCTGSRWRSSRSCSDPSSRWRLGRRGHGRLGARVQRGGLRRRLPRAALGARPRPSAGAR